MVKKDNKRKRKIYISLIFILAGLLLLAYMDIVVLEMIYRPISEGYGVPWSAFEMHFPFFERANFLVWHIAFFTLAILLFILIAISRKNWKIGFAGIILFFTGWEDIFYYLLQFKWLPSELPWLDYTIMGLTRFLTQSPHVISLGVVISAFIGLVISGFILLRP